MTSRSWPRWPMIAALSGALVAAGVSGGASVAQEPQTAERYVVMLAAPSIGAAEAGLASTSQAPVTGDAITRQQDAVLSTVDAEPTHRYDTALNGFSAGLSTADVLELGTDPRVASVTPVRTFIPQQDVDADPGTDTNDSPSFLGLDEPGGVWDQLGGINAAGADQVIGVIDTGLAWDNPSFDATSISAPTGFSGACDSADPIGWPASACTNKIPGARYFADGALTQGPLAAGESLSPLDTGSHGTHVASIAAGRSRLASTNETISGMAPASSVVPYKVCWQVVGTLGQHEACAEDDILAAVDAAVADGVDVINMSLGVPGDDGYNNTPYDEAMKVAAAQGIFIATAGGNYGPAGSPPNRSVSNGMPWVATVAAATHRPASSLGNITNTSSRGPVDELANRQNLLKPDLGAPGAFVLAAVPGGDATKSGTSMAAPHVAGLGALIMQFHPTWSPMAVRSAMQTTARSYQSTNAPFVGGSGYVQPRTFLEPGLIFDAGPADWDAFESSLTTGYQLNTASIQVGALPSTDVRTVTRTVTNVGSSTQTYTAAYSVPSSLAVGFSPKSFEIAPGATQQIEIRLANISASPTAWQSGFITWTSPSAADVRIPVVARGLQAKPEVARWGGTDRYATAALVADEFPGPVDTVYLASGSTYADALAGSAQAANGLVPSTMTSSGEPAPVLLTKQSSIPSATANALASLDPTNIVVLGGSAAIGDPVVNDLISQGYAVDRVSGTDRYATAAELAMLSDPGVPVAYIANGSDGSFADALTGSAAAARDDGVVLLTTKTTAPQATLDALAALQPEQVIVLGGDGAVSTAVYNAVGADDRISGSNRYGTAALVARTFDPQVAHAYVASGISWPDALAGSALAGSQGAPVLITPQASLSGVIETELDTLSPQEVVVLGGTAPVSQTVEDTLNASYPRWRAE
ncbi:cell wall-binding repeat-containing protein [Ornithinimicrobium sp. Arc0846-15]|nr:cell wall-binding repeat-containing protein [Ornithinimicrobium laminariae]